MSTVFATLMATLPVGHRSTAVFAMLAALPATLGSSMLSATFRDGIAGSDDGVVDGGVIAIDSCIIGSVPNSDSSGLDIGGIDVGVFIVSLADDGLCDGAAFAFVSSPPHVLWL